MNMYRTLRTITVNSGEIKLDEKQAKKRRHLLIPTKKKTVFLPSGELCFKAGEVIGLSAASKAMAAVLEEVELDKGGAWVAVAPAPALETFAQLPDQGEAIAAWEGSEALRAEYPHIEDYLGSLGL